MTFQCSRFCRGRREEGTRGSKREAKQRSKNTAKASKNEISRGPGPSIQTSPPKTAKKSPPGGQNDPQERPRRGRERPKSSQDDPKSAPRAPQESPKGGLTAALEAIWGRSGAQEAPGALRGGLWTPWGWILAPPGLPFRSFQRFLRSASCGAFRGASASAGWVGGTREALTICHWVSPAL